MLLSQSKFYSTLFVFDIIVDGWLVRSIESYAVGLASTTLHYLKS